MRWDCWGLFESEFSSRPVLCVHVAQDYMRVLGWLTRLICMADARAREQGEGRGDRGLRGDESESLRRAPDTLTNLISSSSFIPNLVHCSDSIKRECETWTFEDLGTLLLILKNALRLSPPLPQAHQDPDFITIPPSIHGSGADESRLLKSVGA